LFIGSLAVSITQGVGVLLMLASIILIADGVVQLIAGIFGVRGSLGKARVLAIIILVLCAVSLVLSIAAGGFERTALVSLVLPILYLVGVNQSIGQGQ
jgi:hypothetical protein